MAIWDYPIYYPLIIPCVSASAIGMVKKSIKQINLRDANVYF